MNYLSTLRDALTFYPVGAQISADTIRDKLDAAQIPEQARGGLFLDAAVKGYLERTRQWHRTRHPAGRGHLLRVYTITAKARDEAREQAA